jgi:hypothetical protein
MIPCRPAPGRLAGLALLAATALACTSSAPPPAAARPAPGGAGLQAAVDQSGRLRAPTPEEARVLQAAMAAEAADAQARPLQPTRLANGALKLTLDESFHSTALATTSPGGAHAACAGSTAEAGGTPSLVAAGPEDR